MEINDEGSNRDTGNTGDAGIHRAPNGRGGMDEKRVEWYAPEHRPMELQEAADPKDVEVEGDYGRDPDEWWRNWKRIQRQWRFRREDIAWGKKKRAIKSRRIVTPWEGGRPLHR